MTAKLLKALFAFSITLLALALVVTVSLAAWVVTGPKSLSKLTPYIESSFNPEGMPYKIRIKDAVLQWANWDDPLDLRLERMQVTSVDGNVLLNLPEVSVGLDWKHLLLLRIKPKTLVLHNPSLWFTREKNGEFYVGIGDETQQRLPLTQIFTSLGSSIHKGSQQASLGNGEESLIGAIEYVLIEHAHLKIGQSGQPALLDTKNANLRLKRRNGQVWGLFDADFGEGEAYSRLNAEVQITDNPLKKYMGTIRLTNFSPAPLASLFQEYMEIQALDVPLTGHAQVTVNAEHVVDNINYSIDGGSGTFTYLNYFAVPIPIESLHLEGEVRGGLRHFILKQVLLDFGEAKLSATGETKQRDKGWTYDLIAVAENMPVNDLYKYWPKTVAPKAYSWVTNNIREGTVSHAQAMFRLTEEELGQPLPDHALDVTIQAQGVKVSYLPGHPPVEKVAGVVNFTGRSMEITSQKGGMQSNTQLKNALLVIPDLQSPEKTMHIELNVEAPAADVARYVDIPVLGYAKPLALDPNTLNGKVNGKLQFSFPLARNPDSGIMEPLAFLIDADLQDISQMGFMGNLNISQAAGKLKIDPRQLTYEGNVSLEAAPLDIRLTHLFHPESPQTDYRIKGKLPIEHLRIFGVPPIPQLQGSMDLEADITRKQTGNVIRANVGLATLAANIPELGFQKLLGVPATLSFSADVWGGKTTLHAFELKGENMLAKGSASASGNMQVIDLFRLDQLEYKNNKLSLTMDKRNGHYRIRGKGETLDLQPYLQRDASQEKIETPEEDTQFLPFAIDIRGEFENVIVGENKRLKDVIAYFRCSRDYCDTAAVRGETQKDSTFSFKIQEDRNRTATLYAANAGDFLNEMGIYSNMQGGKLNVRGAFDDKAVGRPFKGKLEISKHTITNAPVLAKMASLISLSGIADALRGKGITFDKIEGDITFTDDSIGIRSAKAIGSSLGVTVEEGTVNRKNHQIDMVGTFIPSYTLNTVLDNIPLLGEALSGGKGEGVFAASYQVKGTYPDNVEVSVNPLTMLAPGFLRNLFSGSSKGRRALPQEIPKPVPAKPKPPADVILQAPKSKKPPEEAGLQKMDIASMDSN